MAKDDLFNDEEGMVRMTFGEHLEDLRRRLILALLGFLPGLIIGLSVGAYVLDAMQTPVKNALRDFYQERNRKKAAQLEEARSIGAPVETKPLVLQVGRDEFREAVRQAVPDLNLPEEPAQPDEETNQSPPTVTLTAKVAKDEVQILLTDDLLASMRIITLGPMEGIVAFLKVSVLTGLVLSSWWVIYQLWQFVAEGLYRHERRVIWRATPLSVGLFLIGVAFCFVVVLPVVLTFSFRFNAWLDIDPNIRLSEWLGFATLMPIIFGACFELPLVMLVLEMVGIFRLDDYVGRWRHAVLGIAVLAMVVTPTTDPGSMMLLMGPMTGLYFLGIGLVWMRLARLGKAPGLSLAAKLRLVAAGVATTYAAAVGILFLLPTAWLGDNWFEKIWKNATIPTSYLIGLGRELTAADAGWVWAVTLLNAALIGLAVLRVGEIMTSFARKPSKT